MGDHIAVGIVLLTDVEQVETVGALLARHEEDSIVLAGKGGDFIRTVGHLPADSVGIMEHIAMAGRLIAFLDQPNKLIIRFKALRRLRVEHGRTLVINLVDLL